MTRNTHIAALVLLAGCGTASHAADLVIGGSDGVVRLLDTDTGVVTPVLAVGAPIESIAVGNGIAFVGASDEIITLVDLDGGTIAGEFSAGADNSAMARIGDELVVADSTGGLFYLDVTSGALNGSASIAETDITAMGVDAGGLFVGGQTSIAVRAPIGQSNFQMFAACGSQIGSMAFGSNTMYLGGVPFTGGPDGTVYKFDKFEGGVNYTGTYAVASDAQAMVVSDGSLFVGGSNGNLIEVDPATGVVLNSYAIGAGITAVAPADGAVSCAADYDVSGTLNFFDLGTFLRLLTERLPAGDTNGDGEFNFFDLDRFLTLFTAGC